MKALAHTRYGSYDALELRDLRRVPGSSECVELMRRVHGVSFAYGVNVRRKLQRTV